MLLGAGLLHARLRVRRPHRRHVRRTTRTGRTRPPRPDRPRCSSTGPGAGRAPGCSTSAAATGGSSRRPRPGACRPGGSPSPRSRSRRGRRAGLEVRLQDYKHLGREWDGRFDAVIANGSMEHFVQPADAAAGRDDADLPPPVRDGPSAARSLLPGRAVRHHGDPCPSPPRPERLAAATVRLPVGVGSVPLRATDRMRSAGGIRSGGNWRRVPGGTSTLVHEEDGTEDYRLTSEAWLAGVRRRLRCVARAGGLAPGVAGRRPPPGRHGPDVPVPARQRVVELAVPRRPCADDAAPADLAARELTVGRGRPVSSSERPCEVVGSTGRSLGEFVSVVGDLGYPPSQGPLSRPGSAPPPPSTGIRQQYQQQNRNGNLGHAEFSPPPRPPALAS